jgi:hypothetical protein
MGVAKLPPYKPLKDGMTLNITITGSEGPDGPHKRITPHQEYSDPQYTQIGPFRRRNGSSSIGRAIDRGTWCPAVGLYLLSFFLRERQKVSL